MPKRKFVKKEKKVIPPPIAKDLPKEVPELKMRKFVKKEKKVIPAPNAAPRRNSVELQPAAPVKE